MLGVSCNFNHMQKLLFSFIVFSLLSCSAKSQSATKEKSDVLFKESVPLFMDLLMMQKPDLDSSKIHRDSINTLANILIAKYLEIYYLDSINNKSTEYYIADCYRFNKQYEKAIYWYQHEIKGSTNENNIKSSFEFIGQSFLYLGELDSAMYYIKTASFLSEKSENINQVLPNIIACAKIILKYPDPKLSEILKAKGIKTCQYSIEILKRLEPLTKSKTFFSAEPIMTTIANEEKKCN